MNTNARFILSLIIGLVVAGVTFVALRLLKYVEQHESPLPSPDGDNFNPDNTDSDKHSDTVEPDNDSDKSNDNSTDDKKEERPDISNQQSEFERKEQIEFDKVKPDKKFPPKK